MKYIFHLLKNYDKFQPSHSSYSIAIVLSVNSARCTCHIVFHASDKIFSFSKRDICSVIFIFSLLFNRIYVLFFILSHRTDVCNNRIIFLYDIYSIMQERDGIIHLALKLSSQINYYFYIFSSLKLPLLQRHSQT